MLPDDAKMPVVKIIVAFLIFQSVIDHDDHDRQIHVDASAEFLTVLEFRIEFLGKHHRQKFLLIEKLDGLVYVVPGGQIDRIVEIQIGIIAVQDVGKQVGIDPVEALFLIFSDQERKIPGQKRNFLTA